MICRLVQLLVVVHVLGQMNSLSGLFLSFVDDNVHVASIFQALRLLRRSFRRLDLASPGERRPPCERDYPLLSHLAVTQQMPEIRIGLRLSSVLLFARVVQRWSGTLRRLIPLREEVLLSRTIIIDTTLFFLSRLLSVLSSRW